VKCRREKKDKRSIALFALFVFLGMLSGCARDSDNSRILSSPAQMNAPGYSIGVPQGSAAMTVVEEKFPKCRIEYFSGVNDGYMAVKHGKMDAFAFDRHTLQYVAMKNPDLTLMDDKIADERIVVGAALDRQDLIAKVNEFIRQYKADGTYQDMYHRWIVQPNARMPQIPEPKNPAMTLKIGTDGLNEPMSFYDDGGLTGFDIELVKRLAGFLNAKITYQTMEFSALVIAAQAGKVDLLIADLNATPERRKKMLFSDAYMDSEVAFLVRKDRISQRAAVQQITDLSQLAGKKVGIITGSNYDIVLKSHIPGAVPEYFNNFADQAAAVSAGKIAGFLVDEPIARDMINHTSGVTTLKKTLTSDGYAFAFSKSQSDLQKQVNAALKEMQDDGTLKKITSRWFGKDEAVKVLPDIKLEGGNGVIQFATNSNLAPFAYHQHGKMAGYDIEIIMRIASKLGRKLEIVDMDVAAIIPSLISGKSHMAGCGITITEERAQSVLFSIPNYKGGIVVMVAGSDQRESAGAGSFWADMVKSFKRTFMVEDRYKLVLRGLWVTLLISILSAIAGTLLGFGICMMRRAKTRVANIPAKVFIRVIQGTPIVVLLMILYYIVFGSMDINAIAVAVVGFSINFAAYVSEMMRTGIDAVDQGQHEAAYAIGFNKIQMFTKITFPQAARHVLPVFKGEFISMLKMTSVVGYIAIQDLTKISDIIRSRTYEAFFPLLATALIYFVIAYAMAYLLSRVEMSVDPKQRKRVVKGVVRS
jgi:polar amino acid transport system substrate-binding protein